MECKPSIEEQSYVSSVFKDYSQQNQAKPESCEHEMYVTYINCLPHIGVSFETRQMKYELKTENLFPEP